MAKKVLRSDVVEDGIFDNLKKSAIDALAQVEKLEKVLKSTAKVLNDQLKNAQFGNAESINNFVKATEKANKVKNDSQKLDQEAIKLQQQLIKLDQEEEKLIQQKMRTETQANREKERQAKKLQQEEEKLKKQKIRAEKEANREKERQAKASERAAKAAKDENSEYKKLVKSTRDQKNQSKELAAQMLKLEQSGQKNTKAYKSLESQYKRVTRAAQQGDKALKKIDSTVGDNFRNVGNYRSALGGLKSALGALGVAFGARQLVSFGTESIELFREQQKAIAQVEAGLKSTGNTAGFTSEQLQEMASALQKETIFGDEQILKDATAQLLTFTNISGEQFDRTQQAALDLATRLDGDLKSASIQLGKALNDPVANLSALSRSGIQFSDDQKAVIKSLADSGRLAEAQTLILDELNKQYGGSAKAAAEADGGIQQLKNAIGDAKEEFGRYLLEALKPTIQGLKDFFSNLKPEDIKRFVSTLGTIVSVLGKVVQGFIIFKTTMAAIALKNRIQDFMNFRKELAKGGDAMNKSATGAKAFGKALKGIGFSVAITLLVELVKGLYDFASGAARARREAEAFNKAISKGAERGAADLEIINNKITEQVNILREQLSKREITQLEFEQKSQALTKKGTELVGKRINSLYKTRSAIDEQIKSQRAYVKVLSQRYNLTYDEQVRLQTERNELAKLRSSYKFINSEIETLKDGKQELKNRTFELELQINQSTTSNNANTQSIKDQTDAVKDQIPEVESFIDSWESYSDWIRKFRAEKKEEEDLLIVPDLDIGAGDREVEPEIFADPEEKFKLDKEYVDLVTEYFIKRSNERIDQIDKEINAAQNQYDTLKKLAEDGNIDAKESLAEQQRIIAEANRAKEAEQRRQERIKLAQAAYEAYERNANDETVTNPLAKTITDITLLRQFIQSIPAFLDGTEDTGANGLGVDGKGGFHAILHPNERVMTKDQNAMVGSLTNEQLAKVALDYNTGKMIAKGDAAVAMHNPWESALLIQKIDELNATIRNKPETNIELERIVDGAMTITRSTKKGNTLIYNRHKVK